MRVAGKAANELGQPVFAHSSPCYVDFAGERQPIDLDPEARRRLLEGLDAIALTLRHSADIDAYEARRSSWLPVTGGAGR